MVLEARYAVKFWDENGWNDEQHYRRQDLQHACNWAMALAAQMVREGTKMVQIGVFDTHCELQVFHTRSYSLNELHPCSR